MNEHRSDTFQHLKGKYVTLTVEDEQLQVRTDDGWSLHIYNGYTLSCGERVGALTHASLRLKLVDCLVDDVKMTMMFSGDKILTVDLTDDGYSGPEAMQLNGPDGSIVIWS